MTEPSQNPPSPASAAPAGESEARLRAIVEAAVDGIITIDHRGRIESFNPGAERIFGYREAELIGQNVKVLMPDPYRSEHDGYLERYHRTGERRIIGIGREAVGRRKDGSTFPLDLAVSETQLGERRFYTGIIRDISERKAAEEALRIRGQQQRAVAELSQHALSGYDLERLMNDAVALLAQILEVEFAQVLELDAAGAQLLLAAGVGWPDGHLGTHSQPAGTDSQAGHALLTNAPIVVENLSAETRFPGDTLLHEHGVSSGMTVPIRARARPFGVIGAHSTRCRRFRHDEIGFLQSIADVLATAIERRKLEAELLEIVAREQRRIGHDLHDGLCQHLAGVALRAEALAADLAETPGAQTDAARLAELIRDGTRQARMLSRGLAPVELEANGLMAALEELAANSALLYRIDCRFRCDKPLLLHSHAVATHLYRIAQEAVSNAVRHGRARHIVIELSHRGDQGLLTVSNDGLPLPTEAGRRGGMGLQIMQYRAEMIGAHLRVSSGKTGGATVACTFHIAR